MRAVIRRRSVVAMVVVTIAASAATVTTRAASSATPHCGELPTKLRSLCEGPGVTCVKHEDSHSRWEAVFATEAFMSNAKKAAKRAADLGFGKMAIEVDVKCSNGAGVYEVARARFLTLAGAVALVNKARAAGFINARTEDS